MFVFFVSCNESYYDLKCRDINGDVISCKGRCVDIVNISPTSINIINEDGSIRNYMVSESAVKKLHMGDKICFQ